MNDAVRVFIGSSVDKRELAERLASALKNKGYFATPWCDLHVYPAGGDFSSRFEKQLQSNDFFVFFTLPTCQSKEDGNGCRALTS
jgi:hypothetical protein